MEGVRELRGDGEGALVEEFQLEKFQVILSIIGYPWGAGGTTTRVVAFIVSSESEDFPRGAEKIAKKSRAEKIAAREIPAW